MRRESAIAELRSEYPLGKTMVGHAPAQGCSMVEPERFGYRPGRDIDATVCGVRVLVGNLALMREQGISVPEGLKIRKRSPEVYVAREGVLLGPVEIADRVRADAQSAKYLDKRITKHTVT